MAIVTTDNQHYTDIAAAIRSKNGTETQYKPSEMAAAIQAISGGGEPEPPDDGKTRLYITVPANAMPDRPPPRNQVPLHIQQTVANGVTIDWGDGTEPETLPGTGAVNTTHTYEQAGDYVISLDPADGCELGFGRNSSYYSILGKTNNDEKIYCGMLKKVYIGSAIYSITDYAFTNCYNLVSVVVPFGIISINSYAFSYCDSIVSVVIQSDVISIGANAFRYCYGVKEYHFLSKSPPALSGSGVFSGIVSNCVIYVPKGSAEAYKTATNWTTYAQYIQEEPDPIVPEILKAA